MLALLLVTSAVGFATSASAQSDITAIDDDHGLTDRERIDAFESDGVASTQVTVPDVRLTVAEQRSAVGVDQFAFDFDKRYLRIQYNESLDRTLRVYIPSEYFYPTSAEIDAMNADTSARFTSVAEGRYTAVTIAVEEPTDVVFPIPKAASFVFAGRARSRGVVTNATGYEPPSITADGEWQIVPSEELEGDASYPINASDGATIQYNEGTTAEPRWLTVPDCDGGDQEVCRYEKVGVDDTKYVLSRTTDPPPVRFKNSVDLRAKAGGEQNELWSVPSRFWNDVQGVFDVFGGGENE